VISSKKYLLFFFIAIFILLTNIYSQQVQPDLEDEVSYIGMTLRNLIEYLGAPISVHTARGLEEWQDDVVFVYDEGDFYIYRNRVWQIGLISYRGINRGDTEYIVTEILGSMPGIIRQNSPENSISYSMYDSSWPMILRCDFDDSGRLRGIFIFRSDL